ncbi:sigma 54-interacting transcriptional regulator [Enterococcus sp. AZ103]|uniref:sigma 54-interacting transcriptional regulator n=1 Tax=Enterococcus sp. AZ103 TaxID=2774628 RepID=UPI003F25CFB4
MKKLTNLFDIVQKNFQPKQMFDTNEFSAILMVSRSMSSNYLNQLVNEGYLKKSNSRPVVFWYDEEEDAFSQLVGNDGSLAHILKQCKASANYPPNGIPIILKGNSGVGKSMIAKLIYKYAKNSKILEKNAPFVTLNCADYANNPELLSSMLFGHVKGAYTGADENKLGLLKLADKGYLFLDEVHNLSQENQEKLFLLIDQKRYRQLGDDEHWHSVDIRLILATTEDIDQKLLKTFRRRIPLEITIPDFTERTRKERIELVFQFFKSESERIAKDIYIEPELFQKLIDLNLDGNVGAIQNKVKVYCATSYNENKDLEFIKVPFDSKTILTDMLHISFTSGYKNIPLLNSYDKDFSNFDLKILKYSSNIKNDFSLLFSDYYANVSSLKNSLLNRNKFGILFSIDHIEDIAYIITVFSGIEDEKLKGLSQTYEKYNQIIEYVLNCLHLKEKNYEMKRMMLEYLKYAKPIKSKKNALIVMHGNSIASNMALELNNLIGDYVFDAIDMPMQVDTQEIVKLVNDYVTDRDTRDGLLLLVDMGSLEKMYEEIKDNVSGDLLILNNISTSVALHLGFSLLQNKPMDYYTSIDYSEFNIRPQYFEGLSQLNNIVISCMSGEGISRKVKDIFVSQKTENPLEIITLDFDRILDLEKKSNINSFKNTSAIVCTTSINIPGIQCFNLEHIVNGSDSLNKLNEIYTIDQLDNITKDIIKLFSIEGASERLRFLNPDMVINEIEIVISSLEQSFDIKLENFIRINLFLHLSSMIERILIGDSSKEIKNNYYSEDTINFLKKADSIFQPIKEKYNIVIPDKEYEYIQTILSLN